MGWPAQVPLVGRGEESRALDAALDAARGGTGAVVVVEGEAGIGKTRLVDAVVATARERGAAVALGCAEDVERHRPFGALVDALDPSGTTDLAALLTEGDGERAWDGANRELRIVRAVLDEVRRRCAAGPVVLVLEDLHWSDPATRRCVVRLARAVGDLPLLLVLTTRPAAPHAELGRLLDTLEATGARRLTVGPLAAAEVRTLSENALGAQTGPVLRGQLAKAGGNPLFVLELVAVLCTAENLVRTTDGSVEVTDTELPAVSTAITGRLRFLPEATVELLGFASVLGATFLVADLSLLTGRTVAALSAPLREALAAGALTEVGRRLAFRHALVREALYATLAPELRERLHRELAAALTASGQPPARVAEHVLLGARPGDGQAVRWLRTAAIETGPRAPAVGVELLDRAMELVDPADPVRGPLGADRALALMWAGRGAEGEAACRGLLACGADPDREGMLRWALLRSMLMRGRATEALREIDNALRLATASDAERAHYCASASFARMLVQEHRQAQRMADRAWALAEPTGDTMAIVEAMHAKAHVLRSQGSLTEAAELALSALHAERGVTGQPGPRAPSVTAGTLLVGTDRVARGFEILADGVTANEYAGATSGVTLHRANIADGRYLTGEWDQARAEIAATTALTEDGRPAWPVMTLGVLALVAVRRGDLPAAREHLGGARAALTAGDGAMNEHRMVLAGALLREAGGQPGEALAELVAAWDRFAGRGVGLVFPELGPELVRRLAAAGRSGKAAEVAAAVGDCARRNGGVATITGAALLCRGLVEDDPDVLLAAVAAYRAGPQPLPHALACEDAAAALAAAGRAAAARELLEEALGRYARLGAAGYHARVLATLGDLGDVGTPARTGSRTGARTGWDALTDTERTVLGLLVQRLSNREIAQRMFLSRRTVETHVSHILRKTGQPSRVALAAEADHRARGGAPHT